MSFINTNGYQDLKNMNIGGADYVEIQTLNLPLLDPNSNLILDSNNNVISQPLISFQDTANQITWDENEITNKFTANLPQDIGENSNVKFGTVATKYLNIKEPSGVYTSGYINSPANDIVNIFGETLNLNSNGVYIVGTITPDKFMFLDINNKITTQDMP